MLVNKFFPTILIKSERFTVHSSLIASSLSVVVPSTICEPSTRKYKPR
jgi:hypothetical protein